MVRSRRWQTGVVGYFADLCTARDAVLVRGIELAVVDVVLSVEHDRDYIVLAQTHRDLEVIRVVGDQPRADDLRRVVACEVVIVLQKGNRLGDGYLWQKSKPNPVMNQSVGDLGFLAALAIDQNLAFADLLVQLRTFDGKGSKAEERIRRGFLVPHLYLGAADVSVEGSHSFWFRLGDGAGYEREGESEEGSDAYYFLLHAGKDAWIPEEWQSFAALLMIHRASKPNRLKEIALLLQIESCRWLVRK